MSQHYKMTEEPAGIQPDADMNDSDPDNKLAESMFGREICGSEGEMLALYDERELISHETDGNGEPYIGMEFESEEAAMAFYDAYAKRVGFIIRVGNCHRSSQDGSLISRRFLCNKEGFRVNNRKLKRLEVRKPRELTREGCKAMIMVRKEKSGKWVVTKLETVHSHPLGIPAGKGRRGTVQARPQANIRSDTYQKENYDRRSTSTNRSAAPPSTTSVHVTALDGIVNVNSLFTIAVFVGLSLSSPGQRSLENRSSCDPGVDAAKHLLLFEVVSFSFFLFSSLVAQGLKLAINLKNSTVDDDVRALINKNVLRFGMLASAVGSVMGCLFLLLSMVNMIEIRLGTMSCGSRPAVHAVAALVVLVSSALLVYITIAVYAFLQ
ncbi:hypothetical protein RHSIM_Rhsim13G0054600 [Rhododendron simsii]|uniref:FAR1 domain-containing protein n=1 Tax=Rhododendron simsii TaxID=118357 RepID=A0A834L792_RHOSS|nr:hypothetical protein RHSIM_Rhsim13G0054600 [Rhododendron simsii]